MGRSTAAVRNGFDLRTNRVLWLWFANRFFPSLGNHDWDPGNISAYTATNNGSSLLTATVTVTSTANGCTGPAQTFTVTVNPTPTVNTVTNRTHCIGDSAADCAVIRPLRAQDPSKCDITQK